MTLQQRQISLLWNIIPRKWQKVFQRRERIPFKKLFKRPWSHEVGKDSFKVKWQQITWSWNSLKANPSKSMSFLEGPSMWSSAINGTCYNHVPEYTVRNKVVYNNGQQATQILCSVFCSCSWKTFILQTSLNTFRCFHILGVILQNAKSLTEMSSTISFHWPQIEDTSSMQGKVLCR